MKREDQDFENWAYDRWEEECEDHWIFGEKPLSFSQYLKENEKYLKEEYLKILNYNAVI
jgi:hypothetical protein